MAAGVGVLHLQGVVGFLHQKEEVVVLGQQGQGEQVVQTVVLGVQVLTVQEGEVAQLLVQEEEVVHLLGVLGGQKGELVLVLQERVA